MDPSTVSGTRRREIIDLIEHLIEDPAQGISPNELRKRTRRFATSDEAEATLDALVQSGAGEWTYAGGGAPGRPTKRFRFIDCRGTRTHRIERRHLLYLLAASTGLRFSEIKSLTHASFDFASKPMTVTVEASYSKRRRRDVQPLRDDIAEAMRPFVDAAPKREPLWSKLPDEMGKVVAEDLKAARIPVRDEAGRVVDFHALRHTFITCLARSGVTPKVAQALARHSTITLTMDRYAHVALADTSKALASLPAIAVSEKADAEPAAHAVATGTNNAIPTTTAPARPVATRPNKCDDDANHRPLCLAGSAPDPAPKSQRRSQRAEVNRDHPASSDTNAPPAPKRTTATSEGRRKSRSSRDLGAPCQPMASGAIAKKGSEADGTRTRNHRIDSQPDDSRNQQPVADLRDAAKPAAAQIAARPADLDAAAPDLARLIAAWDGLPAPVRVGINAMITAATAAERKG